MMCWRCMKMPLACRLAARCAWLSGLKHRKLRSRFVLCQCIVLDELVNRSIRMFSVIRLRSLAAAAMAMLTGTLVNQIG